MHKIKLFISSLARVGEVVFPLSLDDKIYILKQQITGNRVEI
jgi:hypothetical protein